jgi:hypothetical protein
MGEPLPNRAWLLDQLHFGIVFVGSAAMAALLARLFDGAPACEPCYGYETIDGLRCVVETGSNTYVASGDGMPECVQVPRATSRIASIDNPA